MRCKLCLRRISGTAKRKICVQCAKERGIDPSLAAPKSKTREYRECPFCETRYPYTRLKKYEWCTACNTYFQYRILGKKVGPFWKWVYEQFKQGHRGTVKQALQELNKLVNLI